MPEGSAIRPQRLREQAAVERQKVQEIDRLLARVEARMATGKGAERRRFERVEADLLVRYRPAGQLTPLVGRVRDLSRSGLRFVASQEMAVGEVLQATFQRRGAPVPGFVGEMYLAVVRCRRADQVWEIGASFAPVPTRQFESSERRRSRRHEVRLEAHFRLPGEDTPPWRGEVRDISAGGMRFFSPRPLLPGALAAVSVESRPRPASGPGTRITLNATIRVVRCRRVGSRYEAGAQFVARS
jgi:hypothetical protein